MSDQASIQGRVLDHIEDLPVVGDGSGLASDKRFYREELQLALRNRGMPLEAMRYATTPTGLHYLVIHFDIPAITVDTWQLTIDGLVAKPLQLTLADLQRCPTVTHTVTLECAGNGRALLNPRPASQPWLVEGVSTAEWTGTSLKGVLQDAGVSEQAVDIVFTGLDRGVQGGEAQAYQRSLTLAEAMRDEVLLAYAMNGEPLPPQHGYPLRLLVPGWYGMTSIKWLTRIEAIAEPFTGYQMIKSYRYSRDSEDPGEPTTLIKPRALMVPPGIPDFATRLRIVNTGPVLLRGRAWAGRVGIARVEVSADHGVTWTDAELDPPISDFAWRGWSYRWDAPSGRHTLCVRATGTDGAVQPTEQFWTHQGMGNNAVQSVDVLVL